MSLDKSDHVRVPYDSIIRETDDAVLLDVDGNEIWLPRSCFAPGFAPVEARGGICYVARWLAVDRGLA